MFTRIRTIKGRRYRYLERRWREGGKVRSQSLSLGPADGAIVNGQITNLGHGGYLEQMARYPSPREALPAAPAPAVPGQPCGQSPAGAPASEPSGEQGLPSDPGK